MRIGIVNTHAGDVEVLVQAISHSPEHQVIWIAHSGAHALELCPAAMSAPSRQVRPTVRTLLERLEPAPAYVVNRSSDVLAWTAYGALDDEADALLEALRPFSEAVLDSGVISFPNPMGLPFSPEDP